MRTSREKIKGSGCYYHLMNRVAGIKNEYPLGDIERETGMRIVCRLKEYYLLEFISMCWMGNHFHIVLYAPGEEDLPDHTHIAARHNAFYEYNPSKIIEADDETACMIVASKMSDISHFMKVFQQSYTHYINKTYNRRGRFWADRFKSTIVEGQDSLRTVVKYVELNPVRAGLAEDPADYRHCTWGWFCGSGKHPFETTFFKHMRRAFGSELTEKWSNEQLVNGFRSELARTIAYEKNHSVEDTEAAMAKALKGETMPVKFLRRMRHISDGGIIGSKLFIQETASLFRERKDVMKKKFSHGQTPDGVHLYCFKQLRDSV